MKSNYNMSSTSIGFRGKGASCSDVLQIRKQKVLANLYSQNNIKTRGDLPVTAIKQFNPDLSVYSQITVGQQQQQQQQLYQIVEGPYLSYPVQQLDQRPLPAYSALSPTYPVTFLQFGVIDKPSDSSLLFESSGIQTDPPTPFSSTANYVLFLFDTAPTDEAYKYLVSLINNPFSIPEQKYGIVNLIVSISGVPWSFDGDLVGKTEFWCVVAPLDNTNPLPYIINLVSE